MNKQQAQELSREIVLKHLLKNVREKDVWRVRVDGKFITTDSGKTAWAKIGHAKNAVKNHLNAYYLSRKFCNEAKIPYQYSAPSEIQELICETIEEMMKDGTIEFVKL